MPFRSVWHFLKKGIWYEKIANMPKWRQLIYLFFRTFFLTSHGFTKSQIQQGASSLTYYSLLALVPMIALLIGISRGFLFEKNLQEWLMTHFSEQKWVIQELFYFANRSLEATQGGLLAGIGIALLLWAASKILLQIELVMNQIWEIAKGRSLARKFTDYLAMTFIGPLIVFLASGLTGHLSTLLTVLHAGRTWDTWGSIFLSFITLFSLCLLALVFTFLYIFMPNTRVRFLPAMVAGIITAFIYQLLQWLYVHFQVGVASYNAIYGTFAAFPLFLLWLHTGWIIILLGAKIAFALQHVHGYEFVCDPVNLSQKMRTLCSLQIVHLVVQRQVEEKPSPTQVEISRHLSMPLLLVTQLTHQLVQSGVLAAIKLDEQEEGYQPAKRIDQLSIKKVLDLLDSQGEEISLPPSPTLSTLLHSLQTWGKEMEKSEGNLLLKDI